MGKKVVKIVGKGAEESVIDIKEQLGLVKYKFILYYASFNLDQKVIAKRMKEEFIEAKIIGCSSHMEYDSEGIYENSVVAIALTEDDIEDVCVSVVTDVKDENNTKDALNNFSEYFEVDIVKMDFEKYVGIILVDGLSAGEEKVMDIIGGKTNIMFIGGSASEGLKFDHTYVTAEGIAYEKAAVMALFKVKNGYDIVKVQSVDIIEEKLVATKVDEETRTVCTFNDKPALEEYADKLGVSKEDVAKEFFFNPTCLKTEEGEAYIRSPRVPVGNDEIAFFCGISEGSELNLCKVNGNIVSDMRDALGKYDYKNSKAIFEFICILRTLELVNSGKEQEYAKLFEGSNKIGFSTYGEEFLGHMNQTSTMLILR
ncbi:MAG TPA: hypothetical protein DEP72_07175 [Clostridiales bacterium]|nr:hypothetical protein [Clostridiales bacterium]